MKRLSLLLSVLVLLLALFNGCRSSNSSAAPDPASLTMEGCTRSSHWGLEREDKICAALVLWTADGLVGLLIETGTPYALPLEDGTVKTDSFDAEGWNEITSYADGVELRAEGCVPAEKPDDLSIQDAVTGWYRPGKLTVLSFETASDLTDAKPVIYLYPETEIAVNVRLAYQGQLTCAYPSYHDGWTVTAAPDGTLTAADGQTYRYLYWEGQGDWTCDLSHGFCVPGEETAAFLERALADLGLTRAEANEFIVYWLPQMQQNPWNLISFQQETYTDAARLYIKPAPDTLIRVFMAWQPLDAPVEVPPQILTAPERTGFTVVEWGGRMENR